MKFLKQHVARCFYCFCLRCPLRFFASVLIGIKPLVRHRSRAHTHAPSPLCLTGARAPASFSSVHTRQSTSACCYDFSPASIYTHARKTTSKIRNKLCYSTPMNTDKVTANITDTPAHCSKLFALRRPNDSGLLLRRLLNRKGYHPNIP